MSFIHPNSLLEPKENIRLGKNVYIAAFACLRADEGGIIIGDNTSVQESCVVHGANPGVEAGAGASAGVEIGKNVTVGHGAIVHGCKVGGNVLVGMNSTLLTGCIIGEWSIIAAGAVVLEGQIIPPKSLVAGVPAKILRQTNEKDRELIKAACENYLSKLKKMGKYEG
ncbi:gamma carbonic anhydrase family protein [Candidatus Parvarchaeota archaeon]|nr:gamma carbonic anhydrase family protein [Candidatus Parvarchaeota archaeon]